MSSLVSLEPYRYPLKGTIQFQLDDIENFRKGSKYGDSTRVGKTEWCILVEIQCTAANKTLIKALLKNLHNFGTNDYIEVKFQFRVQQKSFVKTYNSSDTYTKNSTSWGMYATHGDLNESFEKFGSLLVKCDFQIIVEKIEGTINFFETRPNNKELIAILPAVDCKVTEEKIKMELGLEIGKIDQRTFSPALNICGLPWYFFSKFLTVKNHRSLFSRLRVDEIKNEPAVLPIYLNCNVGDESNWWRIEASAEFRIINQEKPTEYLCNSSSLSSRDLHSASLVLGYLFDWRTIIDPDQGYVKNDKIYIEAVVKLRKKYGFDEKTGRGIERAMKKMTDAIITVEGKQFHVSRMILSHQSQFFCDLFAKNPERTEFISSDVNEQHFSMFLNLVYNKPFPVEEENFAPLLEQLIKYKTDECISRFDHLLAEMKHDNDMNILKIIDKYSLPRLKTKFIEKLRDPQQMKKLFDNPEALMLSSVLRKELRSGMISNEVVNDSKQFYEYSEFAERIECDIEPKPKVQKILGLNEELEDRNVGFTNSQRNFKEFSDPSDMVSFKFKNNTVFYTSKQILADSSVYFMRRFFGPNAQDIDNILQFDLVSPEEINTLLNHIYHPKLPVSESTLDVLLSLSQLFGVTDVILKCENYLIATKKFTIDQKEDYAKKYDLDYLLVKHIKGGL